MPRLYEHFGGNAKFLRNSEQIRLVGLEEAQQRGEKRGIGRSGAQLVCPDSGQVEEPMCPAVVPERCRKRGKG